MLSFNDKTTRIFQQDTPGAPGAESPKVFIYALSTCVYCRRAKEFLKKQGIAFDFVDVDSLSGEEEMRIMTEMAQYNPRESFPTIVIGSQVVVGFVEPDLRKALGL